MLKNRDKEKAHVIMGFSFGASHKLAGMRLNPLG